MHLLILWVYLPNKERASSFPRLWTKESNNNKINSNNKTIKHNPKAQWTCKDNPQTNLSWIKVLSFVNVWISTLIILILTLNSLPYSFIRNLLKRKLSNHYSTLKLSIISNRRIKINQINKLIHNYQVNITQVWRILLTSLLLKTLLPILKYKTQVNKKVLNNFVVTLP